MKSAMHPGAREEFLAAIDYYNDAEPGLGMAFYSEWQLQNHRKNVATPRYLFFGESGPDAR